MKTVTVRLPQPLAADIEAESRARRISKSDVVRERLQLATRPERRQPAALDSIADVIGSVAGLPMSLADACLVRMTETLSDPIILTTDADFRIYRRHSRHVVPCVTPN